MSRPGNVREAQSDDQKTTASGLPFPLRRTEILAGQWDEASGMWSESQTFSS